MSKYYHLIVSAYEIIRNTILKFFVCLSFCSGLRGSEDTTFEEPHIIELCEYLRRSSYNLRVHLWYNKHLGRVSDIETDGEECNNRNEMLDVNQNTHHCTDD